MKTILNAAITLFMGLFFFISSAAQTRCDVKTNNRDDGTSIRYLRPDRIGYSDYLILALSLQTNGQSYYVAALSVFQNESHRLIGSLILGFNNDNSCRLESYKSELTTYNGYTASITIFEADEKDLKGINQSNLKFAVVKLDNGVSQTITVKMNDSILRSHLKCLTQ